jgi:hypothetical protein
MSEDTGRVRRFDWVSARSECSLASVYEKLKLEIQNDVETRNHLRPELPHYGFKFIGSSKSFTVLIEGNKLHKSVTFQLAGKIIEVQSEEAVMFNASVGLNDEGECVLRVNGEDRTTWQVAKMALERLFFETV